MDGTDMAASHCGTDRCCRDVNDLSSRVFHIFHRSLAMLAVADTSISVVNTSCDKGYMSDAAH